MLPADRVQVRICGHEAVPLWMDPEDHVWLRVLIDDVARLEGRTYRQVTSFLREPPRMPSPGGKRAMAIWTLLQLCGSERPPLNAALLRETVVLKAQQARDTGPFDRAQVLALAGQCLGLSAASADEHLFADLPGERRLRLPRPLPDHHSLATRTNMALAQGLLRLASEISIELYGGARPIVRQVHLRRLLCVVRRIMPGRVRLDVSGAYSLFRHTTMYGRALASILPVLAWCDRFDLAACCVLRGRTVTVRFRSGDPIAGSEPPRAYDSRLEERFARDFRQTTLDWDLVREPEPVPAGDTLVFPDFAVVHRRDTSKRCLLEIVGFWTPDYLRAKLDRLDAMPQLPLVLCIDRALNCSIEDLPPHARVVWFNKRIEPRAVLAAVEAAAYKKKTSAANSTHSRP